MVNAPIRYNSEISSSFDSRMVERMISTRGRFSLSWPKSMATAKAFDFLGAVLDELLALVFPILDGVQRASLTLMRYAQTSKPAAVPL